jgi:hypothetical protein
MCQSVVLPVVLSLAVALPAGAQSLERRAFEDRIAGLEAEVAQLEAVRGGGAASAQTRADELRALVGEVLADADTRIGFLDGQTAGWDGHPFLASADGNFRLEVEARLQLRHVLNVQDDAPGVDTTRAGFEARRIRFIFSGNVVNPSITYKVQSTFNRNGGASILEDAFIRKDFDNGAYLRAGQFRPPYTRESLVSTFRTTAVERSLAHGAIELSRTQGVEAGWQGDMLALRGMFHDGDGMANTPALAADTEYALSARGEVLVAGGWKQFRDFTGYPGGEFGLLLGAGVHYERGEFGASLPDRPDDFRWTFDASAEFSGAELFAAVGGRHVDPDAGDDLDVIIAMIQGGLFITDDVEAFGRFEWGDDDSSDHLLVLTIGATKFWKNHDLKWTTDFGYAFDAVSGTFASTGAGWREDPTGSDGQIVVRSQLQLVF